MAAPANRFVRPLRCQAPLRTGGAASIDRGKSMTYGISGVAAGRAAWRALFVLIACTALAGAATAASLAPERLPAIQAVTFEVVAAKPVDDPLSYEKPLPLDLLPFQQRNDKYSSIATAFSIGGGRSVTPAHALLTGAHRPWGPPAQIGRDSCAERVVQIVENKVVGVT